jgi:hypothetical protein
MLRGIFMSVKKYPSITNFLNVPVAGATILLLSGDKRRVGVVICNRSATTVYIGKNADVTVGSGSTVRLLQNEILTLLKEEGDDPAHELWSVASAASVVEIVESVEY